MGTHDKDTRKERKAKKKAKEGQAYKAESGLYKKSEFYKNADERYTETSKTKDTKKGNTSISKPTQLHPEIVKILNSKKGSNVIQYLVDSEGIGFYGITRELFPIFEEFDSNFTIKAHEIASDNRLTNEKDQLDDKILIPKGAKLKVTITQDELDVLRAWNTNHNIRYHKINYTETIDCLIKEKYRYKLNQYKNPEDKELLKSYFPHLVHDDEYLTKYNQVKELNKTKVIIHDEQESFSNVGIALEITEADVTNKAAISEFESKIDGKERNNRSLPSAGLQKEFMDTVMKKNGISYASVYAKEMTEKEFKGNPFEGKEVGQVISHGSGENSSKKEYTDEEKKVEATESSFLTKEGFDGNAHIGDDESISVSELGELDLSSLFLMDFSACQSGLDANWTPAEKEHIALLEQSLKSGAKNAIGNLWNVEDTVQPYFTYIFYTELFKDPERDISKALRKSQLLLMTFFGDVKQWASFQYKSNDFIKEDYEVGNKYRNELESVKLEENDKRFEDPEQLATWRKVAESDAIFKSMLKRMLELQNEYVDANNLKKEAIKPKLELAQLDVLLYDSMAEENHERKDIHKVQKKLKPNDGVVEIKRIDGEMGVQYVALITSHHSKERPTPVLCAKNETRSKTDYSNPEQPQKVETNLAENQYHTLYKNDVKFRGIETLTYEFYWSRVQEELDRQQIKKIYFSAEGIYEEISIYGLKNQIENTTKSEYVIEKIEIQSLF